MLRNDLICWYQLTFYACCILGNISSSWWKLHNCNQTWTHGPCTNRSAAFLSMPWRSQVTCPWLSLVAFFRMKVQLFREICSAVTLGLMDGRSPLSFEMVRTTSAFSSHTITVHWELLLQVNRASSPCRTVRVSGTSVTWAAAATGQRGPVSINNHLTEQENELHTLKPQIKCAKISAACWSD